MILEKYESGSVFFELNQNFYEFSNIKSDFTLNAYYSRNYLDIFLKICVYNFYKI